LSHFILTVFYKDNHMLASSTKYLIIGAGIHGLSTSYHLALELKNRGLGSGKDILVIDKSGIGAGASGIACGVVQEQLFPACDA